MSRILLTALALGTLAGCAVLTSPDRKFAANDPVLRSIEAKMRYVVDPDRYRLVRAEVAEDAVTLHYLGVEYPGDQAWVVRFSEKSTELAPESLASVEPALAVIDAESLQPEFAAGPVETTTRSGVTLETAAYTFHSTLAPIGRSGRGILAAFRRTERGQPVVYQLKLDNHGDRDQLTVADLAPFLAPFDR